MPAAPEMGGGGGGEGGRGRGKGGVLTQSPGQQSDAWGGGGGSHLMPRVTWPVLWLFGLVSVWYDRVC